MNSRYLPFALLVVATVAGAQQPSPPAKASAGGSASTATPPVKPIAPMAPVAVGAPSARIAVRPMPVSSEDVAYANREAALIRELRLAELEAKIAEAKRKTQEGDAPSLKGGVDAVTGMLPLGGLPGVVGPASMPTGVLAPPPIKRGDALSFTLMSVWGTEGSFLADVATNGLRVTVKPGDSLPGGWVVGNIGRTGMLIKKGKTNKLLRVGG